MKANLDETIVVARSLADCFRYVKDFSTIEQWDPGVYRAEKITSGPVHAGTEFALQLNVAGARLSMTYQLCSFVENEQLVLEGEGRNLHAVDTIDFRDCGDGRTEIHYRAELRLKGVPQIASPAFMPVLRKVGSKAVGGLKTALTLPAAAPTTGFNAALKDRLVLPAALDFTERGYLAMPNKALSQFMDGKTVVITGPTSGLGLAAAKEFSRLGASLVLVGRGEARLGEARQEILAFSGAAENSVDLVEAELSLMAEVSRACDEILSRHKCIDVLVNNAGVLPLSRQVTAEGNELTLAVNLLAPVLLMHRLLPALKNASGRVINVASGGMYLSGVALGDMQFSKGAFDGTKAYARAKRALVSLTECYAEDWQQFGVDCHSMHPGWASTPGVAKSLPVFNKVLARKLRDARMGADTVVWLAASQELAGLSGGFWFDRQVHTTAVVPGTALSSGKSRALKRWVNNVLGLEGNEPLGLTR